MKFKVKIEVNDLKAALRTAGALLVGNSFVVPVLAKTGNIIVGSLFVIGIVLILTMSLKGADK